MMTQQQEQIEVEPQSVMHQDEPVQQELPQGMDIQGPVPQKVIARLQPLADRNQTDVCCLILGIMYSLLLIGAVFYLRNPQYTNQINFPSDSNGKVCGFDIPSKPFLNFTDAPLIKNRVCVATCPANTVPHQNLNGKLCYPSNKAVAAKLHSHDKTSNTALFFLQYQDYYLILALAVILAFLLAIAMQTCPETMMHTILFLCPIAEILLGLILYLYSSQSIVSKGIISTIFGVTFILFLLQIILYRQTLAMNKIFLSQAKKFLSHRKRLCLYIIFFSFLMLGLIYLAYLLYIGGLSVLSPILHPQNIYYIPNNLNFIVLAPILAIYAIWASHVLKQLFSFFIAVNILYVIYHPPGEKSAFVLSVKLAFKHMGSIFAAAFINSFMLFPAAIYDTIRNCGDAKFTQPNCMSKIMDMVRSDALTLVALTGTPYCNAANYCDYFWYESMTTEKTSCSLRVYKLAAHIFISVSATIAGLFYLGNIQGSIVYFDLICGLALITFFIQLPIDVTDCLRLLYLIEEEGYKRRNQHVKFSTSVLSRIDQMRFVKEARQMYQNKQLGEKISKIRQQHWKIQIEAEKKKGKKKKQSSSMPQKPSKAKR